MMRVTEPEPREIRTLDIRHGGSKFADREFNVDHDGKPHGLLGIYRLEVKHAMRTDVEIESDVVEELKWNPDLDSTDIAVRAKDDVLTLAGFVKSYVDKTEAEASAKRVAGVVAVANDLAVRLPATDERPDPEIAREAVASLRGVNCRSLRSGSRSS
jgi:hypothetical protein